MRVTTSDEIFNTFTALLRDYRVKVSVQDPHLRLDWDFTTKPRPVHSFTGYICQVTRKPDNTVEVYLADFGSIYQERVYTIVGDESLGVHRTMFPTEWEITVVSAEQPELINA